MKLFATLGFAFALLPACTTLGPMPATTGISAVPSGRPGAEISAGATPGYMISEGTRDGGQDGSPTPQLLGVVEPGRLLGTRGLIAGARYVGRGDDMALEPMLGYRHRITARFTVAAVGHATTMGARADAASYAATRAGLEVSADAELVRPARWLAIHGQATVGATYLDAHGTYCTDAAGQGVDCAAEDDRRVDARIQQAFPAATATLAVDLGRDYASSFHGSRIAVMGTAGLMPRVRDGVETGGQHYLTIGLAWTIGFGAER
jgi:hypothetical protein